MRRAPRVPKSERRRRPIPWTWFLCDTREKIRLARRRDDLDGTVARLERQVLEQGDGLDETALRTAAAGTDADAAMLRLRAEQQGPLLRAAGDI
jgi:hypothetical protein